MGWFSLLIAPIHPLHYAPRRSCSLLTALDFFLELNEARAVGDIQRLTAKFHRHLRGVTVHAGKQYRLDTTEYLAARVRTLRQLAGNRLHETVGQQNPQKRPDQRSGQHFSEYRGRFTDRAHDVYNAHHGHHDTEGWQRVAQFGEHARRFMRLFMMGRNFSVHQGFDFERIQISADHHAQIIRQKFDRMMIGQYIRIALKKCARFWRLDIVLDRHQPFLAHFGEHLVQQTQQIDVERLVVAFPAQYARGRAQRALDDARRGPADEGTDHQTENRYVFDRHPQRHYVSVQGIGSDRSEQDDHIANCKQHGVTSGRRSRIIGYSNVFNDTARKNLTPRSKKAAKSGLFITRRLRSSRYRLEGALATHCFRIRAELATPSPFAGTRRHITQAADIVMHRIMGVRNELSLTAPA